MINVIISDPFTNSIGSPLIETAVNAVLTHQNAPNDSDISVLIGDNDQVHALNLQFLGIDAPTDVLAFPSDETDPETGNKYLGDIIISYPLAFHQAQAASHSIETELSLLVVHGTLHLLGFDHADEMAKKEMWTVQEEILGDLGVNFKPFLYD